MLDYQIGRQRSVCMTEQHRSLAGRVSTLDREACVWLNNLDLLQVESQHPRLSKKWRYLAGRLLPLNTGQELQRWTDGEYRASCRLFHALYSCVINFVLCLLLTLILAHFWTKPLSPLWLSVYLQKYCTDGELFSWTKSNTKGIFWRVVPVLRKKKRLSRVVRALHGKLDSNCT